LPLGSFAEEHSSHTHTSAASTHAQDTQLASAKGARTVQSFSRRFVNSNGGFLWLP
jgi:hypothetical protein